MPLPPIFRLEPGQQRSLRLLYTGEVLPSKQESLYWLNLYEIPPKPIEPVPVDNTRLTITMRTQMKVIYRPRALAEGAEEAPRRLKFNADGTAVEIENPTPYFITLAGAEVHHGSTTMPLNVDLLAPFTKQVIQTGRVVEVGDKVQFMWVDDDGNFQTGEVLML
ncbi:pili assembly chaperone [Pseudomonas mucidolens]|nr:pili assembly chaperone [Pseudomonas mucidolens]